MVDPPRIQYLNTDLDLICNVDPTLLVAEFEARDLCAHIHTDDDGLFYVRCDGDNDTEPEPNILRLLDTIDALSDASRDLWNQCTKREFNVGYDCGDEPWSFNQGLSNEVLRRMADCGSTFRITLYPHRPDSVEVIHDVS
ncbi:MAG: hypothetical protein AAF483_22630 [Planctomycetota bacterium]